MDSSSSSSSSSSSPQRVLQSSTCVPTERPVNAVIAASIPNPTALNPPADEPPGIRADKATINNKNKKKAKMALSEGSATSSSPPPSPPTTTTTCSSSSRGVRVASKRRSPRVALGLARRSAVADAISFRLGMSIAAFVAEILERKDASTITMFDDHLALICASAVRESLANDFGDTFDSFVSNFEKSFRSSFRTLRLIRELSINKENYHINRLNVEECTSDGAYIRDSVAGRGNLSRSTVEVCHPEELFHTTANEDLINHSETIEDNEISNFIGLELAVRGQTNELTSVSPSPFGPIRNGSVLSAIEKSVVEQARFNDLKTLELGLTMKKLKMKEMEMALHFDSNNIERSKLEMGISKASFQAEKFKTQLADVRHAELIRMCVDCLVAGLLLMAGSLTYGAYVYSYQKITDATAACTPSTKESKSWWFSNPMATFNSGIQTLSCQFQVVIRMLFGIFLILSITYLLFQRSSSSERTMPITFLVLLLALICGAAGKFCVDTLGGSGYHWLVFWEMICLVHFLCNVCTPTLFFVLYGPLTPSPGTKDYNPRLPYWIRRLTFYGVMLLFLPLLCGLLPFASIGEWKDHLLIKIDDYLSIPED